MPGKWLLKLLNPEMSPQNTISRHTWNYDRLDISYDKTGSGPPLLILHGWGSSSQVMLPVARQLADRYTCFVIDLPGFGRSPEPDEPWTLDDYTNLAKEFITYIGEPVDILAHSFGGRIVLKILSSEHSEMLRRVLITGGAGMKPKRTWNYYLRYFTAKTLKAPFLLLPQPLRDRGLARLRETSLWKLLGSSEYRELDGVMQQTFINIVTEHLDDHLPEIQKDILLLWGKADMATPLYQAKRMESEIEGAALVTIDDAGHYAFLDQPGQFMAITREYLKGRNGIRE